ncbi:hypothetical protein CRYUN_Cryun14cG0020200 [Craigia yunnanensis]
MVRRCRSVHNESYRVEMEIWRLPISAPQRGKLISVGYTSLFSLSSIFSSDFARELKVSESEAMDILKVASHSHSRGSEMSNANCSIVEGAQNAWDMLHEEESLMHITTSSADLDNILGGGIHCKEVTGIDTEGSFMVERAFQIAEVCVEAMSEYNRFLRKDFQVVLLNQVITKHMEGSFQLALALVTVLSMRSIIYTTMVMNGMHILTSHLLFDQHQHQHQQHILLQVGGLGIPPQAVNRSK